jgi:hypothetical protein
LPPPSPGLEIDLVSVREIATEDLEQHAMLEVGAMDLPPLAIEPLQVGPVDPGTRR